MTVRSIAAALRLIQHIEQLDLATSSEQTITDLMVQVSKFGRPLYGLPHYNSENIWYRAQICPGIAFQNLRRMIYAPPELAKIGRANSRGESTHYSAWNLFGALSEVHAKTGDLVQVIAVRTNNEVRVPTVVVGELAYWAQSGRSLINAPVLTMEIARSMTESPEKALLWYLVDAFFSRTFRKPVAIGAPETEYLLSACLAHRVQSSGGATIFPSVRSEGVANIAVPAALFDKAFEVLYTQTFRVAHDYHSTVFALTPELFSNSFQSDGTINWSSKIGSILPVFPVNSKGETLVPEGYRGWSIGA